MNRKWKKEESLKVAEGKRPYFLKNSDKKREGLVKKFQSVPESKIDKILEAKRKRNAQKTKTSIPFTRRSMVDYN